ncbi:hypothetical protein Avbf_07722 [Armadillidium vulgare]|nr:hypothetical protein Avbf_07722 [Armadillidium vulgare]
MQIIGASPYSMSGTPGPMMSPPPGEDSMGYGIPGMNGSGYSGSLSFINLKFKYKNAASIIAAD